MINKPHFKFWVKEGVHTIILEIWFGKNRSKVFYIGNYKEAWINNGIGRQWFCRKTGKDNNGYFDVHVSLGYLIYSYTRYDV